MCRQFLDPERTAGNHLREFERDGLQEEGTSYKTVCQRAQQNLASAYLSNPALSLQDVALLTGYTEVSSFSRAFKAWTGMTVTDYRKENRETS